MLAAALLWRLHLCQLLLLLLHQLLDLGLQGKQQESGEAEGHPVGCRPCRRG